MLQYCVLYAKIQKLNMSNIMNKTNSDNEVYEESDLPTRPGAGVRGARVPVPPHRCSFLAWAAPNYVAQKINYNRYGLSDPSDNESIQCQLLKLETNVKYCMLRSVHENQHCSYLLRCGNKHQRREASLRQPFLRSLRVL